MSTQTPPATGINMPFKNEDELAAFLKRVVVEETNAELDKKLAPLNEKQIDLMKGMLEEHHASKATALPKGHMFVRQARAQALAFKETGRKGDADAVISTVKRHWGTDDPVLKAVEASKKLQDVATKATAAQASDPSSLGLVIAPQWSTEYIELLRARPTIRKIARVIPNPTGSLTLRRATSAGTAYWVGEGQTITTSKPGVGLMNFLRKKLAALYIASNDLLRYSVGPLSIPADQLMLDDMLKVTALAEDLAFIRSDGGQYSPRGIRNLMATANVFAQTGTTLTAIDADFMKALRLLEEANIYAEPDEIHWLMVPRTWGALWNAAPATDAGARPYRQGLEQVSAAAPQGRILGAPVHKTNQIPKNLGGGGNQSETYCVYGPGLWIADTLNVQIDVFPGGAYQDGNAVVSGISTDETPIRLLKETDFNMQYQEGASCITGVTLQ